MPRNDCRRRWRLGVSRTSDVALNWDPKDSLRSVPKCLNHLTRRGLEEQSAASRASSLEVDDGLDSVGALMLSGVQVRAVLESLLATVPH